MTERDSGQNPRERSILQLEHVQGIRIGEEVITPFDLLQEANEISRVHPTMLAYDLSPTEQTELLSDEFILRNIIFGMLPITITGNPELPPVMLKASLTKFFSPLHPNEMLDELYNSGGFISDDDKISYGVRFVPEVGEITHLSYRDLRRLSSWGLQAFSTTDELTTMSLHNLVHIEIYHRPHSESELPPLVKPEDRRK